MRIYSNYRKYKKRLNSSSLRSGTMSVEAVFVVPLVLFSLFLILFFSFYTYQQVWFTEAAYEAVLSQGKEEEKAKLLLEEAPLTLSIPSANMKQSKNHVQITYEGQLLPSMGRFNLKFKAKAEIGILRPVDYIRKLRLIKKLT